MQPPKLQNNPDYPLSNPMLNGLIFVNTLWKTIHGPPPRANVNLFSHSKHCYEETNAGTDEYNGFKHQAGHDDPRSSAWFPIFQVSIPSNECVYVLVRFKTQTLISSWCAPKTRPKRSWVEWNCRRLEGHKSCVNALKFSSGEGRFLASAGDGACSRVLLWLLCLLYFRYVDMSLGLPSRRHNKSFVFTSGWRTEGASAPKPTISFC